MRRRIRISSVLIPLLLLAAGGCGVFAAVLLFVVPMSDGITIALSGALFAALGVGIFLLVRKRVAHPLDRLAADAQRLADTPAGDGTAPVTFAADGLTGGLGPAIQALRDLAEGSAREVALALKTGAGREEQLRRRLETVIRQLSEGVLVCDAAGRIQLFNAAASRLLAAQASLKLGESLQEVLAPGPIDHALSLLERRAEDTSVPEVICSAASAPLLLRCRLSRLPESGKGTAGSFVVTFTDVTGELAAERERDDLIRSILDDLRPGLANLRAAAENLTNFDDLPNSTRRSFEKVVAHESATLSDRVGQWAADSRIAAGGSAMVDIRSDDLIDQMVSELADERIHVTRTGTPLWVRADSHTIAILLAQLVSDLASATGTSEFDAEVLLADRGICLDIVWEGQHVPATATETWQSRTLSRAVGAPTVAEVLRRHRSELWSQPHRQAGFALLRIPLPLSPRQWQAPREALPARPEFYDFDLDQQGASALLNTPLVELSYVAFDTETTGLEPELGDELIAIAGVRLAGGRVLSAETFDELIKPGAPIPPASVRYHGIADKQVRYKPPAEVIVPKFAQFVGNEAVLVAHNAAFDMHFLAASQGAAPIDNAVLDVLLLAVHLDPGETRQTLGSIAGRLGLPGAARRSVLDDALLTGSVFTELLPRLEAAGIHTLGQALDAMQSAAAKRQAHLGDSSAPADSTERTG